MLIFGRSLESMEAAFHLVLKDDSPKGEGGKRTEEQHGQKLGAWPVGFWGGRGKCAGERP